MSKIRNSDVFFQDIIDACTSIQDYTRSYTFEQFSNDNKTIDAVVRNLEIIGEAANRLPKDFTDQHPKIEWVKIIGLRNRIVHEYFGVDLQMIWQILKKDLPAFKASLKDILSQLDD